ncbi:MAG: hypothetical protein EOO50_15435 [Flavobacterium sp.]|uniref:hypothetical protein n=1 Tax=Flavobacterium sp. TaxID=239 RepID=UPI00120F9BB4|nr:hypothetical protein [Flavobacterium sp.]RZJ64514.1 MAG: hypothetical protein EOO50_15435 [Flavobacterium sp.]
MTGVDFGFGELLACAISLVILVPTLSVALIHRFRFYSKANLAINVLVFITVVVSTVLVIRKFGSNSFKFLLGYLLILALLRLLNPMKKKNP